MSRLLQLYQRNEQAMNELHSINEEHSRQSNVDYDTIAELKGKVEQLTPRKRMPKPAA